MRKPTGFILAAGMIAAASLTGCVQQADCVPDWVHGGLAPTVQVTGDLGGSVTTEFPTPLVQLQESTTALSITGDGPIVERGQMVSATASVLSGATGEVLTAGSILWSVDRDEPRLAAALVCAPVGSRVVLVGPISEVFGATAAAGNGDETIVTVIDILDAYLGRANGTDRLPQNGLPTVSLAPDGRPGLTFTNSPAPTDLRVSVLKAGSGAEVGADDTVVLHYTGVSWNTHKIFDSTWDKGIPAAMKIADTVPGFRDAVVGQKVGSQILVAVPPGFGYEGGTGPVAETDTMVFVIDVLGIQKGS